MRRITILLAAATALMLIPAAQAFAAESGPVKVIVVGNGSGEVTSVAEKGDTGFSTGSPPIECPGVCETEADAARVQLFAYASAGSEFVSWNIIKGEDYYGETSEEFCNEPAYVAEGYAEYGGPYCVVDNETNIPEGVEIEVEFALAPPLTIAKTGEGTVTSSPAGIECTGAKTGAECQANFKLNEMVTLTASPAAGYAFGTWSGCTEHVGLTCKVTMDKAKTVKVGFVKTPTLTVEKTGSGQGKVGATGISCDENCSSAESAIKAGSSVTIKTTPAKGSEAAVIENGTGSASSCSGATCTFTIEANSSVKVKFAAIPTKTLTVNLTGPAAYKGKVTGKGTAKGLTASAISCGSGCTSQTESFFSTDTVTLTAAAGTGYTFAGWSGSEAGTCTGKTSPCTISTSANKTLSAKFE